MKDRPQFSILHSKFSIHTAVFAFFAMIATLSAQKGGTNAPPNGASPPQMMGMLRTENCIGPMTVSFQGVKVFEVPCTNAIPPIGYFNSTNYTGHLMHTANAGAGVVHRIGDGNYWAVDEAGRSDPYLNWFEGQLTWKIPIGWKRLTSDYDNSAFADVVDYASHLNSNSRPLLIGNREDFYIQVFTISEHGTSSVEKFGHRLTRSRWSIWGELTNIQ